MLAPEDYTALLTTVKLAVITTTILLIIGTPLAWWLTRTKWRFKVIIEAIIALPLVLPPTVLGFYLLILLGSQGPVGVFMQFLGLKPLAFTFAGLVVGSVCYSLPFVVQPLQNSFAAIGDRPFEVAATLGASPVDRFFTIALPLAGSGFLTATVLGFAHTVGEFGVVLMIGGNIPDKTEVLSIAIYNHVEMLQYDNAHILSGGLLVISFLLLLLVYGFNRKFSFGSR